MVPMFAASEKASCATVESGRSRRFDGCRRSRIQHGPPCLFHRKDAKPNQDEGRNCFYLLPIGGVLSVEQARWSRSEEHTSELQSHSDLVCRLLLEKKKKKT